MYFNMKTPLMPTSNSFCQWLEEASDVEDIGAKARHQRQFLYNTLLLWTDGHHARGNRRYTFGISPEKCSKTQLHLPVFGAGVDVASTVVAMDSSCGKSSRLRSNGMISFTMETRLSRSESTFSLSSITKHNYFHNTDISKIKYAAQFMENMYLKKRLLYFKI